MTKYRLTAVCMTFPLTSKRTKIRAETPPPPLSNCRIHRLWYAVAGSLDADCPIWDHVVQLFVCCEDPDGRTSHCDKCDVTPWMSMAAEGEPSADTLVLVASSGSLSM